jgi:lipopolysaccharide export system permease protein
MIKLIDRQLFINFVKSYLICLVSLLSLYIVVDLFNNLDDFAQLKGGFWKTVEHVGLYYAVQTTYIFDRLSEAIALLAAMFTMAWVQRNNELLPMLSAGVSTRRVVLPVLVGACAMILVNLANEELLIPTLGSIPVTRGDPALEKSVYVGGCFDSKDILLVATGGAVKKENRIDDVTCVIPAALGNGGMCWLSARQGQYIPPVPGQPRSGGWLLTQAHPAELPSWSRRDILEPIDPGKYFLYTDSDFERLTRERNWFQRASTWKLFLELGQLDSNRLASMAVYFHMRLTRPLLGMILVVMGLSIILRDQNRNVFLSAGFCMVLGAGFYALCMAAKYLGDQEFLSPPLAAWLPVFIFGPVVFVLFDAVHT